MALNEVIKEGEYYRSYDKPNQQWLRHYFFTTAKCVFVSASQTLDNWIANIDEAVTGIISQDPTSTSTSTVPSSAVFKSTVDEMKTSFQDGCDTIAAGVTSNGGTMTKAGTNYTPSEIVTGIGTVRSPNRGQLSGSIGNSAHTANSYSVTAGYYTGGSVTLNDSNLAAGNIKKDVKIFGVTGTYDNGSANVKGNAIAAYVLQSTGANNTGTAIKFSSASAGSDVQGTMVNNGTTANQTINCGASFTVKKGYHDSAFTVTAQTLASATADGTLTNNGTAGQTYQMLNNYVAFSDGVKYTGKIPVNSNGAASVVSNPNNATTFYAYFPWGYYPNANGSGSLANRGYCSVSDSNLVSGNIRSGVTIFGVTGNSNVVNTSDGTLTNNGTAGQTNQMLNGFIAYSDGVKYTGKIQSRGASTITPSTSNQTIAAGVYLSGTQTISGDANLVAGNIKSGVKIFGVTGTYSSTFSGSRNFKLTCDDVQNRENPITNPTAYGLIAKAACELYIKATVTNNVITLSVYDGWIRGKGGLYDPISGNDVGDYASVYYKPTNITNDP